MRKDLSYRLPRAETSTHLITLGFDVDLDDAAKQALREMINWLVALLGIGPDEAYALCSIVPADLRVTQTVNGVKESRDDLEGAPRQRPRRLAYRSCRVRLPASRVGFPTMIGRAGQISRRQNFDRFG